jgi:succinoglycan biosynthesis protein ExoM
MRDEVEHVNVCVLTYKRPWLLEKLLIKLTQQITLNLFSYSIVVIDNDIKRSAYALVSRISTDSPIRISYWCEPQQNIARARNRAVSKSDGNYIAFIDDDEVPESDWLLVLFKTIHFFDCDGIQGPVRPYYDKGCPDWAIKAKFYDRPLYTNGTLLKWKQGRTGNLLIRRAVFNNKECLFDEKFGSGAEDQDFFRRALAQGYQFRYTREAVAYEYVPSHRCNPSFLVKRALLRGKVAITHPDFGIKDAVKSTVAVPFYFFCLPILLVFGYHYFILYLTKLCDHLGKCLSLLKINTINVVYVTN